jgi:hypothetical protein
MGWSPSLSARQFSVTDLFNFRNSAVAETKSFGDGFSSDVANCSSCKEASLALKQRQELGGIGDYGAFLIGLWRPRRARARKWTIGLTVTLPQRPFEIWDMALKISLQKKFASKGERPSDPSFRLVLLSGYLSPE